jgi:hypothetical protein
MPTLCRCLFLLLALSAVPATADEIKAVWVWEEETFRLLDDPTWRDDVLDRLGEDGINALYLYADSWQGRSPIVDEPGLYDTLIREAHGRGFRVEALLGSKYLGTNRYVMPDKRDEARAMLERVLAYNRSAEEAARFAAIQFDIEPYTLPEWKTDQNEVAEYFAEAAQEWSRIVRDADSSVGIGAAIPFWFEKVELGEGTLVASLMEVFDYVALMAYRDKAEGRDGIIAHSRYEVEAAGRLGRKVIVGVETDQTSLDKLTFLEEGRSALDAALGRVSEEFRGSDGYAGVAVHHLRSYLTLD